MNCCARPTAWSRSSISTGRSWASTTGNIASSWSSTSGARGTSRGRRCTRRICSVNNRPCATPCSPALRSTPLTVTPTRSRWPTCAQLINCLHSLFLAHEDKFVLTPTFHVFEMFMPHMGGTAVRAVFSAPEVQYTRVDKPAEFWGLAGSASVSGKQLTLTVTNPHLSEPRDTEIAVRGARASSAQAQVLTAPDVHAHNTFEKPRGCGTAQRAGHSQRGRDFFPLPARVSD